MTSSQQGNVNDISITHEGEYTVLRMPTTLANNFREFLNSPKVASVAQDGPQDIRSLYEALKSKWQSTQESRSGAASST